MAIAMVTGMVMGVADTEPGSRTRFRTGPRPTFPSPRWPDMDGYFPSLFAIRRRLILSDPRTATQEAMRGNASPQSPRRLIMGSMSDKVKGAANQVAGAVKEAAGHAVGNPNLEVEGAAQKLKGKTQEAVGKTKDAIKEIVDKA
ncbi:CsbD family protein [Candidatus Rhodoblastus alkanivorans]